MLIQKENPLVKANGFFYVLFSEEFGEYPNDYGDYKNHDIDSDAHSGLKNISY